MKRSAFLFALQLGDSGLPTGRFSHSYGLEELLGTERLGDAEALAELVESVVLEAAAPLDGVAVAEAHRLSGVGDVGGLRELDRAVTARKLTPSTRRASTACGGRLAALTKSLTNDPTCVRFAQVVGARDSDGNLAVVEGALARALDIGLEEAILLELRGTSVALLSAALRLGKISALKAQAIAAALIPTLADGLEIALALTPDEMRAVVPELDIAAMSHGRRDARIFAT
jgi:urease accessory protein